MSPRRICWTVRPMGGETVASFMTEAEAIVFCFAQNAATFRGRYQVERCHIVAGVAR